VIDASLQFNFSDGRTSFHNVDIGINRRLAAEKKTRGHLRRPLFDSAAGTEAHDQTNRITDYVNTSALQQGIDWDGKKARDSRGLFSEKRNPTG